ncbi:hypothetical protein PV325_005970, partial [Microctonus aethiopoides]
MTTPRQCAVVWWFETNNVSTTLLDVLPYQHRVIGAETMISGHKAKVVAICSEDESKDAVASMNCMLNNANHSTTPKTPVRRQNKGSGNTTVKKINPKKAVADMQMSNKHECQSSIGDIVPVFQNRNESEKQIHNNAASFSIHSSSSYTVPFKNELSTSLNPQPFSVQPSIKPSLIASTAANASPRHFNFSKIPLSFGPIKTSNPNIAFNNAPQYSTLNSVLSPVNININDSSSLSSVKLSTNTNCHGAFDNQSPQNFFPSWYSSHANQKMTPLKPNNTSHSSPINFASSPSILTDLDSWQQSSSIASNSNLSSNSEVKERKIQTNILSHSQYSKCLPSPNPSISSNLALDNIGTNDVTENFNEELVQIDSHDDSNTPPSSPAVFSLQQMNESQKENMKMICSTLGVTKENIQFLQNICNIFKQYLDDEKKDEIEQSMGNIVVIGPEYFEASENRVEIFPGGGFYMPSNIWNLICLTHGPEFSNWKAFVRDVLIQVYEDKLPNYTAKGKRGRPSIDGKLLKALFKKINETRSRQEQ